MGKKRRATESVSMLVSERILKFVREVRYVNTRIMYVRFSIKEELVEPNKSVYALIERFIRKDREVWDCENCCIEA